ncbi:hypothetical protein [Flavobacterium sp. XS2P39]|uniref:hypothetical protein n=1 Tax=Flavobacterium sp. XS2P39 TaxID=3401725 RepID=UPI003AADF621
MKTSTFSLKNASIYYVAGFLSILLTSCGSYQNSSYYDGDGIYGNTAKKNIDVENPDTRNNYYKNYFGSLQDNNGSAEIFTDVDNYSNYNTYPDTNEQTYNNYSGWGSNSHETIIDVSPNYWGFSLGYGMGYPYNGFGYSGFGWNYPYYGYGYSSFGWNYPYYGWGYPSYGWNFPYYGGGYSSGHYNNYSYNPSRRGSSYSDRVNSRNYSTRTSRDYSQNPTNTYRGTNYRNSTNRSTRTSPTFTRNQNQNNSFGNPTRRSNTNSARSEGNSPARSYTPNSRSENSSSRSYSSGSNNSNNNSGGGGGRSSSGGGRR